MLRTAMIAAKRAPAWPREHDLWTPAPRPLWTPDRRRMTRPRRTYAELMAMAGAMGCTTAGGVACATAGWKACGDTPSDCLPCVDPGHFVIEDLPPIIVFPNLNGMFNLAGCSGATTDPPGQLFDGVFALDSTVGSQAFYVPYGPGRWLKGADGYSIEITSITLAYNGACGRWDLLLGLLGVTLFAEMNADETGPVGTWTICGGCATFPEGGGGPVTSTLGVPCDSGCPTGDTFPSSYTFTIPQETVDAFDVNYSSTQSDTANASGSEPVMPSSFTIYNNLSAGVGPQCYYGGGIGPDHVTPTPQYFQRHGKKWEISGTIVMGCWGGMGYTGGFDGYDVIFPDILAYHLSINIATTGHSIFTAGGEYFLPVPSFPWDATGLYIGYSPAAHFPYQPSVQSSRVS